MVSSEEEFKEWWSGLDSEVTSQIDLAISTINGLSEMFGKDKISAEDIARAPDKIKRVYHALAMILHPDNAETGDARRSADLNDAYGVLETQIDIFSVWRDTHNLDPEEKRIMGGRSSASEKEILDETIRRAEKANRETKRIAHEAKKERKPVPTHLEFRRPPSRGSGFSPKDVLFGDWKEHSVVKWILSLLGIGLGFYVGFIHNLWMFGIPLMIVGLLIGWPEIRRSGVYESGSGILSGIKSKVFSGSSDVSIGTTGVELLVALVLFGVVTVAIMMLMNYLRIDYDIMEFAILGIVNSVILMVAWMGGTSEAPAPAPRPEKPSEEMKALEEKKREKLEETKRVELVEKRVKALESGQKDLVRLQPKKDLVMIPEYAENAHTPEELEALKKKKESEEGGES